MNTDILDIVAYDAQGVPVLAVEAKAVHLTPPMVEQYRDYLRSKSSSVPVEMWVEPRTPYMVDFYSEHARTPPPVPFGLLADLDKIYLYDFSSENSLEPLATLATPEILAVYDPEYGAKRIFESYLAALIDAWIRDLAFHWKSPVPPGSDVLWRIGLMEKIRGGDTRREVPVAVDSVC